jgi:hypothetical protein
VAVDLVLAPQAFWRELVDPGEDHCERQTQQEQAEKQPETPRWHIERAEQQLGDLQQHPACDEVQRRYPEHVPPPQFRHDRHSVPLRAPHARIG